MLCKNCHETIIVGDNFLGTTIQKARFPIEQDFCGEQIIVRSQYSIKDKDTPLDKYVITCGDCLDD